MDPRDTTAAEEVWTYGLWITSCGMPARSGRLPSSTPCRFSMCGLWGALRGCKLTLDDVGMVSLTFERSTVVRRSEYLCQLQA